MKFEDGGSVTYISLLITLSPSLVFQLTEVKIS